MATTHQAKKRAASIQATAPPTGKHSIAIEGTAKENRSPIYRHWMFQDGPCTTFDPAVGPDRYPDLGFADLMSLDTNYARCF